MAEPNTGSDPINPNYYAGTACAEIIEHMPANVAFAFKYAWRLGQKDEASQEAKKAVWYLRRELLRDTTTIKPLGTFNYWFRRYAEDRVDRYRESGKIDLVRSEIMFELVEFTMTGKFDRLLRAIDLFQTFTGENHAGNEQ